MRHLLPKLIFFLTIGSLLLSNRCEAHREINPLSDETEGTVQYVEAKLNQLKELIKEKEYNEEQARKEEQERVQAERKKRIEELDQKLQAKQHQQKERRFRKYRDELKTRLHNQDVVRYKEIQKIARKLYYPVYHRTQSPGGQVRLHYAILFLSELYRIHNSEEYGSPSKIAKLAHLKKRMKENLTFLDMQQDYLNNISVEFTEKEKTLIEPFIEELFRDRLKSTRIVSSIGASTGLTMIFGGGVGGGFGRTSDSLGERKIAVLVQAFGEMGLRIGGPFINVGYYSYPTYDTYLRCEPVPNHTGSPRAIYGGSLGCVFGAGFGNDSPYNPHPFKYPMKEYWEGTFGLSIGLALKDVFLAGYEVCSLPTDWKKQRRSLCLTKTNGTMPRWIETATTLGDLNDGLALA